MYFKNEKYNLSKELQFNDNCCFKLLNILGKGSYALVVSAKNIKTDQIVAIKMIDLKLKSKTDDDKQNDLRMKQILTITKREYDIMNRLRSHKNIVDIYDYFSDNFNIYLIIEFCSNKVNFNCKITCKIIIMTVIFHNFLDIK